eukprot:gnl/MRDRNA2_/MRDRNA2_63247_c0_seq2.p1 gnl/MRDRNA2_/MRDRNA2_63247_c0~~gnl/MRDRNA2_/MRDRNA2_63247_c0_seq2.p1  ORF type:complete len:455 (+),score=96.11 gnl/MRDRNA2_/MRDRNA2_63247_c0_seq2:114-1478(+)
MTIDGSGTVHSWEWWSTQKCTDLGVDNMEMQHSNRGDDLTSQDHFASMVEINVPATPDGLEELLTANKIDYSQYGVSSSKSLKTLSQELLKGECRFMAAKGQLVRMKDLVALRLRSRTGKLVVESEPRSRQSLPATSKRTSEDCYAAAKRLLFEKWALSSKVVKFSMDADECIYEEEEDKTSTAYPGLTTIYCKRFVDAMLISEDPKLLGKIGIPQEEDFVVGEVSGSWLTEEKCKEMGITVYGALDGLRIVLPSTGKEDTWTAKTLSETLLAKGVEVSSYGHDGKRTLDEFRAELTAGTARLMQRDDALVRVTQMIVVRLQSPDGLLLVEVSQTPEGGSRQEVNQFPRKRCKMNEDKLQVAASILQAVNMDMGSIDVALGEQRMLEEQSSAYPGLTMLCRQHIVNAFIKTADTQQPGKAKHTKGRETLVSSSKSLLQMGSRALRPVRSSMTSY